MLIDDETDQVRLTKAELNRIRKYAALQGECIGSIKTTNDLDAALIKTCSVEQIETLIRNINACVVTD